MIELRFADLIRLCHNDLKRHGGLIEKRHDFFVYGFGAVAAVDQNKDAPQSRAASKVSFQQPLPFFNDSHRRVGKTITRKVDDVVFVANGEKVDLLGAAWGVRGTSKPFTTCQRVNQAGFTNVGSTRKAQFDPICRRHAVHGDDTFEELDRSMEQHTTSFDDRRVQIFNDRKT